jgi:putative sterol carrier protein
MTMTGAEVAAKMNQAQAWLPGKRVKMDLGSEGILMLDGQASTVTQEDGAADTTLKADWETWQQLFTGQMDGMTAFMMGKLKVEGDMSNAMQLQGVLSKLKG